MLCLCDRYVTADVCRVCVTGVSQLLCLCDMYVIADVCCVCVTGVS